MDEFEQDWADVTGGKYTIDEVAAGTDVQDLYDATKNNSSILDSIGNFVNKYGTTALNSLKSMYTKPGGGTDWAKVAGTVGGLYGLYNSMNPTPQQKTGYQGGIPKYEAVRAAVPEAMTDTTRRPGSGGQRYFSDTKYVAPGEAATAAHSAAKTEAAGLQALNKANVNREDKPTYTAAAKGAASGTARATTYADGGIATLAQGGTGRYLGGATDGMADKIPARIDGKQEAKLSHGEFVIPADVVSHLGNGNSDAGAQRLYAMMDKIRKARTGSSKQGKQINPNKYLPA